MEARQATWPEDLPRQDLAAADALAADILEQLLRHPGLSDPRLHFWISPAASFSGDVVAAAEGRDGRFYALLADATGHGIDAAVGVLPVLTHFYGDAAAGGDIEDIVHRVNARLCAKLPVGRFVAAAFVRLDAAGCEFWLGGMPTALLIDAQGNILARFDSNSLPLGVAPLSQETATSTRIGCPYPPGAQLVLCSDGLIEAPDEAGEPFGLGRLAGALSGVPAAARLAAVRDAVSRHLDARPAHDDISLLLLDLPPCAGDRIPTHSKETTMTNERYARTIASIDAANAADPRMDSADGKPVPRELLYGQRMTEMIERFAPQADEVQKISVRGQHIQRWKTPRDSYPMTREGYLQWRTGLYKFHAETVGRLMEEAGYDSASVERAKQAVGKRGLKVNPDTQLLEDVTDLVFIEHYMLEFAGQHAEYTEEKWLDIIRKTWKKMSPRAHEFALSGKLKLPAPLVPLITKAVSGA